ncbi:hypothetical protein ACX0G9_08105 [Flavitalea flava]
MKLIMLAYIAGCFFIPGKPIVEKWVIEKNSSLSFDGKSNVNSFRCDVGEYLQADTIEFYKEDNYQQSFIIKGGPAILISRFDCHQRNITADMRKTLKADKNSTLKIGLLSLDNFTARSDVQKVKGWVAIELAGITRKMEIGFTLQNDQRGYLHLGGKRKLLFSDFGLTPPRKLAGLIKVKEEINVSFQLVLRPVQMDESLTIR